MYLAPTIPQIALNILSNELCNKASPWKQLSGFKSKEMVQKRKNINATSVLSRQTSFTNGFKLIAIAPLWPIVAVANFYANLKMGV